MPEKLHGISDSTALRFDLSAGPFCVTCSKNVAAETCALQCIAEQGVATDVGGDLPQRLRLRVRCLEKELASLTAKRSEYFAKKAKETEERCNRLLKQKDDEQSAWYAAELDERKKLRAAATLMFNIHAAKYKWLQNQMDRQRLRFEEELKDVRDAKERQKAESQAELKDMRREHAQTCADYESQLKSLRQKKEEAEEHSRRLQDIVDGQRKELASMKNEREKEAKEMLQLKQQLAEADKALEELRADTRIKAIEHRARQEKAALESEVMDYVKYIMCTPEGRSPTPDFPWEWLGNPSLAKIAMERKRMPIPPSRPATSIGFQRRAVPASSPLPFVGDRKRASSAMGERWNYP
jgi:hypothetical protein